jgi:uncharacterized protein YqjF (DUF2071 family)
MLTAPLGSMEGRRRPLRPWHVLVTLEDLLILTWAVPEETLRRFLPRGLTAWTKEGTARISAVLFRNRRLRPAFPGWPRLSCFQMNLRTYVLDPSTGGPGAVFFHGLFLSKRWLSVISSLFFRAPFRFLPLRVSVRRSGGPVVWEASSPEGSVAIRAEEKATPDASDPETLDLLTNAHTGYVARSEGSLARWSLWHRNKDLRAMHIDEVQIVPLAEMELPLGPPCSALLIDAIDYEVYLPARAVKTR